NDRRPILSGLRRFLRLSFLRLPPNGNFDGLGSCMRIDEFEKPPVRLDLGASVAKENVTWPDTRLGGPAPRQDLQDQHPAGRQLCVGLGLISRRKCRVPERQEFDRAGWSRLLREPDQFCAGG